MKDNIKKQLETIRRDAVNELDNFALLTRTVVDSDRYTQQDCINSYIINLYEMAHSSAMQAATSLHDSITKADYSPNISAFLSGCERIIVALTNFYFTVLPSHTQQIQGIIENNAQVSRDILTAFLSVIQALQNQLKES